MINIELIYDTDCSNVIETRTQLKQALTAVGLSLQWLEWNRANPKSPAHVRGFGSPTILVDGQEVAVFVRNGWQASPESVAGLDRNTQITGWES